MEKSFTVELGAEHLPGQRWAYIKFGNATVFSEIVYDNHEAPAERNISFLFAEKLRRLLEED